MSEASPKSQEDYYAAAQAAYESGDIDEAISLCRAQLQIDFDHVRAIVLMAGCFYEQGKLGQSHNYLKKAHRLKPDDPKILQNFGISFMQLGKPGVGRYLLAQSINLVPDNEEALVSFIQSVHDIEFQQFDPVLKQAMMHSLRFEKISQRTMFRGWYTMLRQDPAFARWRQFEGLHSYEQFKEAFNSKKDAAMFNEGYLCIGIRRLILNNDNLESVVFYLRRYFLLEADAQERELYRPFLSALAHQNFYNEYMLYFVEEEAAALEALIGKAQSVDDYILISCYMPLYKMKNAQEISDLFRAENNSDLTYLAQRHIEEPLEEEEIKKTIPSFTEIDDEISQIVKQQYEENPYPRWLSVGGQILSEEQKKHRRDLDILIAGCGTGQQTSAMCVNFPEAKITAFDLSFSSLAYGIREIRKSGFNNVDFYQGDLLKVADFNKSFDMVACGGVLHHMDSPKDGLRALRDVVKTGGTLRIALYSEIARRKIVMVQNWIKEKGYTPTSESIRQFRYDMMQRAGEPEIEAMKPFVGIFSLSETRDTYFNVQEHRFTCLQLKEMIEELDLELIQFELNMPKVRQAYAQMFPDDVHATNLENWHEYEQQNPDVFITMYTMLLARKGERKPGELPAWMSAGANKKRTAFTISF